MTLSVHPFLGAFLGIVALLGAHSEVKAETKDGQYQRNEQHYKLPDLKLVDTENRQVVFSELVRGNPPVLVNFVFASCTTLCPILTATFAKAQTLLAEAKEPARFVSISIDPEQDTPEQLKKYAEHYKAGPDWIFLTGEADAIESLQKAFAAYRGGKANHPSLVLIRARADGPWIRLEGALSAATLVKELRAAKPSLQNQSEHEHQPHQASFDYGDGTVQEFSHAYHTAY